VYQHNFGGSGGSLNGTEVDVGEGVWETGPVFLDDGTVGPSSSGQAAWLPFEPGTGGIYTAEATVLNPGTQWIAFGFLREDPPVGVSDWTQSTNSVRHSNAGGYAWMLALTNTNGPAQEIFDG